MMPDPTMVSAEDSVRSRDVHHRNERFAKSQNVNSRETIKTVS